MPAIPPRGDLTPRRIALVYLLAGGLWILLTDGLVSAFGGTAASQQALQSVKGLVFVGGSALLVYLLTRYRQRELQHANERLARAVQQNSVYLRLLRHNVRNVLNVIDGHAELLEDDLGPNEHVDQIRNQVVQLVEMTEKARHLSGVLLGEHLPALPTDVVATVEREVERARADHPEATIATDLPDAATAAAASLAVVVRELLENAVVHQESDHPEVEVTVTEAAEGPVELAVADAGPGVPSLERETLERPREDPLTHSQGIGLWVVRSLVAEAGGALEIDDNEPRGSVIRVTLPGPTTTVA